MAKHSSSYETIKVGLIVITEKYIDDSNLVCGIMKTPLTQLNIRIYQKKFHTMELGFQAHSYGREEGEASPALF